MGSETHVMLDLETLGTAPGSVILSIGAVKFGNGGITSRFHTHIKPASCEQVGLVTDISTMMWWLEQSDEARRALISGQKEAVSLQGALAAFNGWLAGLEVDVSLRRIWGNGASFDCALLAAAHRHADMRLPWRYSGERCYRTVKALNPQVVEDARDGTHHDALADAEHQAKHLMKILPEI